MITVFKTVSSKPLTFFSVFYADIIAGTERLYNFDVFSLFESHGFVNF